MVTEIGLPMPVAREKSRLRCSSLRCSSSSTSSSRSQVELCPSRNRPTNSNLCFTRTRWSPATKTNAFTINWTTRNRQPLSTL